MEMLLTAVAVMAGLILLLQVVVMVRRPLDHEDRLIALADGLARIEEQGKQLNELGINAREARDTSRKVSEEMAETRGRLSSFAEAQSKAGESIAALQGSLPLQIAEGIRSVMSALQESLSQQVVPELAAAKAHITDETRKNDDRFQTLSESTRILFKSLEAALTDGQGHFKRESLEQGDRSLAAIEVRLQTGFQAVNQLLEQMREADGLHRQEIGQTSSATRAEITTILKTNAEAITALITSIESRFTELGTVNAEAIRRIQQSVGEQLVQMREEAVQHRAELTLASNTMRTEVTATLKSSGEAVEKKMEELRGTTDTKLTELKGTVDLALKEELGAIRVENGAKLEEMRRTVDEKLHATLEQRLGDSFKLVSERLEQVHRGLGEMQTLATGVGDLKKVLSNVKTRGTWGEVQLEALLDQIMTPEQYGKNLATKPGSAARVEFAIRLPGRDDIGTPVWLPIDAKFPLEDYQRLVEAQERVDLAGIAEAGKALEVRIKLEARTIREKYISPPHTTDFAILYLPTEGLYAEVLRRPGLTDTLQREFKINVAGPTTLAAMLNSLQMGFRTLAIEKRSSEVWTILGAVKTEFEKFGTALAHTRKKLQEATNSIDTTEQRNRVLTRKLAGVEGMSAPEAALLIDGLVVPGIGSEAHTAEQAQAAETLE
jgi:DNA recombination protein RmuC